MGLPAVAPSAAVVSECFLYRAGVAFREWSASAWLPQFLRNVSQKAPLAVRQARVG